MLKKIKDDLKLDKKSVNNLVNIFEQDFALIKKEKWNPYNIKYMIDRIYNLKDYSKEAIGLFISEINALGYHKILVELFDVYNNSVFIFKDRNIKKVNINDVDPNYQDPEKYESINRDRYNTENISSEINIINNNLNKKINMNYEFKTSEDFNSLFKKQEW